MRKTGSKTELCSSSRRHLVKEDISKKKQNSHKNLGASDKPTTKKNNNILRAQTPGMEKKKSCPTNSSAKKVSVHNIIFPEKNEKGEFVHNSAVRKQSQVSSMKQIPPAAEESKSRIEIELVQQQSSEDHKPMGTVERLVEGQSSIEASHQGKGVQTSAVDMKSGGLVSSTLTFCRDMVVNTYNDIEKSPQISTLHPSMKTSALRKHEKPST